jgi:hypothetical protein
MFWNNNSVTKIVEIPKKKFEYQNEIINYKLEIVKLGVSDFYINDNNFLYYNDSKLYLLYLEKQNKILNDICNFINENEFKKIIVKRYENCGINYIDYDVLFKIIVSSLLIYKIIDDHVFYNQFNENIFDIDEITNYIQLIEFIDNEFYKELYEKTNISIDVSIDDVNIKIHKKIIKDNVNMLLDNNTFCNDDILNNDVFKNLSLDKDTESNQDKFDNEDIYSLINDNNIECIYNINRFSEFNKNLVYNIINEYNNYIVDNLNKYQKFIEYKCISNMYSLESIIKVYYNFIMNLLQLFKDKNSSQLIFIDVLIENSYYQQKRKQISENIVKTIYNLEKLKT